MSKKAPSPQCLLRRSPLLPGESLSSLLARLVQLNGYETLNTFRLLVLPELAGRRSYKQENWDNLHRPFRQRTYERLASATKLNPLELYAATEHSMGLVITPPEQELETIALEGVDGKLQSVPIISNRVIFHQFYTASATQYCPLCLREDDTPYHRLLWSVRCIAACTRHEVVLMDKCAECRSAVQVRDVVAGACRKCNAEFAKASPISVAGDQIGLLSQQLLQTWLLGEQTSCYPRDHAVPQQPPRVMYRLVQGLANTVWWAKAGWDFIHQLSGCSTELALPNSGPVKASSDQMYRIYATAVKSIMDWPSNFFTFLSGYCTRTRAERDNPRKKDTLLANLGPLYDRWLLKKWQSPGFAFVQEAFDLFLVANQAKSTGVFRSNSIPRASLARKGLLEFITIPEAQKALRLDRSAITKLVKSDYLRSSIIESSNFSYTLIHIEDVSSLAERWKEGGWLSTAEAARLAGITWRELATLRSVGR